MNVILMLSYLSVLLPFFSFYFCRSAPCLGVLFFPALSLFYCVKESVNVGIKWSMNPKALPRLGHSFWDILVAFLSRLAKAISRFSMVLFVLLSMLFPNHIFLIILLYYFTLCVHPFFVLFPNWLLHLSAIPSSGWHLFFSFW